MFPIRFLCLVIFFFIFVPTSLIHAQAISLIWPLDFPGLNPGNFKTSIISDRTMHNLTISAEHPPSSTLVVSRSSIDNVVVQDGNGVTIEHGSITFDACTLSFNAVSEFGGIITVKGNSTIAFIDCIFISIEQFIDTDAQQEPQFSRSVRIILRYLDWDSTATSNVSLVGNSFTLANSSNTFHWQLDGTAIDVRFVTPCAQSMASYDTPSVTYGGCAAPLSNDEVFFSSVRIERNNFVSHHGLMRLLTVWGQIPVPSGVEKPLPSEDDLPGIWRTNESYVPAGLTSRARGRAIETIKNNFTFQDGSTRVAREQMLCAICIAFATTSRRWLAYDNHRGRRYQQEVVSLFSLSRHVLFEMNRVNVSQVWMCHWYFRFALVQPCGVMTWSRVGAALFNVSHNVIHSSELARGVGAGVHSHKTSSITLVEILNPDKASLVLVEGNDFLVSPFAYYVMCLRIRTFSFIEPYRHAEKDVMPARIDTIRVARNVAFCTDCLVFDGIRFGSYGHAAIGQVIIEKNNVTSPRKRELYWIAENPAFQDSHGGASFFYWSSDEPEPDPGNPEVFIPGATINIDILFTLRDNDILLENEVISCSRLYANMRGPHGRLVIEDNVCVGRIYSKIPPEDKLINDIGSSLPTYGTCYGFRMSFDTRIGAIIMRRNRIQLAKESEYMKMALGIVFQRKIESFPDPPGATMKFFETLVIVDNNISLMKSVSHPAELTLDGIVFGHLQREGNDPVAVDVMGNVEVARNRIELAFPSPPTSFCSGIRFENAGGEYTVQRGITFSIFDNTIIIVVREGHGGTDIAGIMMSTIGTLELSSQMTSTTIPIREGSVSGPDLVLELRDNNISISTPSAVGFSFFFMGTSGSAQLGQLIIKNNLLVVVEPPSSVSSQQQLTHDRGVILTIGCPSAKVKLLAAYPPFDIVCVGRSIFNVSSLIVDSNTIISNRGVLSGGSALLVQSTLIVVHLFVFRNMSFALQAQEPRAELIFGFEGIRRVAVRFVNTKWSLLVPSSIKRFRIENVTVRVSQGCDLLSSSSSSSSAALLLPDSISFNNGLLYSEHLFFGTVEVVDSDISFACINNKLQDESIPFVAAIMFTEKETPSIQQHQQPPLVVHLTNGTRVRLLDSSSPSKLAIAAIVRRHQKSSSSGPPFRVNISHTSVFSTDTSRRDSLSAFAVADPVFDSPIDGSPSFGQDAAVTLGCGTEWGGVQVGVRSVPVRNTMKSFFGGKRVLFDEDCIALGATMTPSKSRRSVTDTANETQSPGNDTATVSVSPVPRRAKLGLDDGTISSINTVSMTMALASNVLGSDPTLLLALSRAEVLVRLARCSTEYSRTPSAETEFKNHSRTVMATPLPFPLSLLPPVSVGPSLGGHHRGAILLDIIICLCVAAVGLTYAGSIFRSMWTEIVRKTERNGQQQQAIDAATLSLTARREVLRFQQHEREHERYVEERKQQQQQNPEQNSKSTRRKKAIPPQVKIRETSFTEHMPISSAFKAVVVLSVFWCEVAGQLGAAQPGGPGDAVLAAMPLAVVGLAVMALARYTFVVVASAARPRKLPDEQQQQQQQQNLLSDIIPLYYVERSDVYAPSGATKPLQAKIRALLRHPVAGRLCLLGKVTWNSPFVDLLHDRIHPGPGPMGTAMQQLLNTYGGPERLTHVASSSEKNNSSKNRRRSSSSSSSHSSPRGRNINEFRNRYDDDRDDSGVEMLSSPILSPSAARSPVSRSGDRSNSRSRSDSHHHRLGISSSQQQQQQQQQHKSFDGFYSSAFGSNSNRFAVNTTEQQQNLEELANPHRSEFDFSLRRRLQPVFAFISLLLTIIVLVLAGATTPFPDRCHATFFAVFVLIIIHAALFVWLRPYIIELRNGAVGGIEVSTVLGGILLAVVVAKSERLSYFIWSDDQEAKQQRLAVAGQLLCALSGTILSTVATSSLVARFVLLQVAKVKVATVPQIRYALKEELKRLSLLLRSPANDEKEKGGNNSGAGESWLL